MGTLTNVASGRTMQIIDLNQIINVLQQPSGGQELGSFYLEMAAWTDNALCSMYVFSRSRNATPISVSLTVASRTGIRVTSPATNFLTHSGFQLFANSAGAQGNATANGTYTINY
jgi:hypothetical protein